MIVYDFEVFKHDWLICWLDLSTRKMHYIINDQAKFEQFYQYYKDQVWIGYNSRGYDQYIAKAILSGFNPYEVSKHIIIDKEYGYSFSQQFNKFPIYTYDCIIGFKSLKELEGFMGHDIRETDVPFDLDRKLTVSELKQTLKYCMYDVDETFEVFLETKGEYESQVALLTEFNLPLRYIGKTKAQIASVILEARNNKSYHDEFDIILPDTLQLSRYKRVELWYRNWSKNVRNYDTTLDILVAGVPHKFAYGGLHGAISNYIGDGVYVLIDVDSYYPALMIEYDCLSRNVRYPKKYREIRDDRLKLKADNNPRAYPRKIVLNSAFGGSKFEFSELYDPRNANITCINGQLFLLDLIEKLETLGSVIQSNTDGILLKIDSLNDMPNIYAACDEWSKRTRMTVGYDFYRKVIQKDVNNYILVEENGDVKSKGSYVKKLSRIDNDLPIVNKAVVDYFTKGISPQATIQKATKLIDFQKINKVGGMYKYTFKESFVGTTHTYGRESVVWRQKNKVRFKKVKFETIYIQGEKLTTKVNRVFASTNSLDGRLLKMKADKTTLDKVGGTPEHCVIINDNILEMELPDWLDKQWYIDLANERISEFLGK